MLSKWIKENNHNELITLKEDAKNIQHYLNYAIKQARRRRGNIFDHETQNLIKNVNLFIHKVRGRND